MLKKKAVNPKNIKWGRNLCILAVLILFVAGGFAWAGLTHMPRPEGAPDFPRAELSIRRADGKVFHYKVEVATTLTQEMYGLMFRRSLAHDRGMIFVYEPDQPISMWMKNTYIPLDMVFMGRDGTVTKIITGAKPLDLTPLSSDEPVHGVIEINAGEAAKHGFKAGDKVLFPGFGDQL